MLSKEELNNIERQWLDYCKSNPLSPEQELAVSIAQMAINNYALKYYSLKGEYIGTLKGLLLWPLPPDLERRIRALLERLEQ